MAEKDPQPIDFGRPTRISRLFGGRMTQRFDLRTLIVCLCLFAAAVAIGLLGLASGEYPVPLGSVLGALIGHESGRVHMVVIEWRLPRTALALILGCALGVSGAIFQSIVRNPLGSPDVIGFGTGAYTGALVAIAFFGGGRLQMAGGAFLGGLATAGIVSLLAFSRGGIQGPRLIIIGIGVSAMLTSVNTWMLLRAKLEVAMTAAVWGAGSLNGATLDTLQPAGLAVVGLLICALILARPMRQLEMGDDIARASGVNAPATRLMLTMIAVCLTATATAVAGPIGFVALTAPQLARRLTGAVGSAIMPAAAMGAMLLVTADDIAQHAFAVGQLPVGIVTLSLGGVYFVWLLIREGQRQ